MVIIHAQINSIVTFHFTADNLFVIPAPIIEPVIVWVVLTGIPNNAVANSVIAPPVSALNPSNGLSFVIFCSIVFTIRQPPDKVPSAIEAWHASTIKFTLIDFTLKLLFCFIRTAHIIFSIYGY